MILTAIGEEEIRNEMEEEIHFYSFTDPFKDSIEPILHTWIAYKETPKGYWIVPDYHYYGEYITSTLKKWIQKEYAHHIHYKKRFAYQNKEDALYSYYRRKLQHIRYVSEKHNQLKYIIRRIENMHGFFGAGRPICERVDDSYSGKIQPLKDLRPIHDFINEDEMLV